jgi:hypothetical protein
LDKWVVDGRSGGQEKKRKRFLKKRMSRDIVKDKEKDKY